MQMFETTDPKLARRCRYAQYRNEKTTLTIKGSPVTGLVCSVREDRSSPPARWVVTVVEHRGLTNQGKKKPARGQATSGLSFPKVWCGARRRHRDPTILALILNFVGPVPDWNRWE